MPPDADTVRQRKAPPATISDNSKKTFRVCSLKHLQPNEVCIDGIIYDLNGFHHPGGEAIHLFGGNDVTVQYRMIHPRHTGRHREKMTVVGRVSDHRTDYKFGTDFENEIKREVFAMVSRGREFATFGYWARALGYVTLYAVLQYLWLSGPPSLIVAVAYGLAQALIGLNVQHDGNHGAVSGKYPILNDLLGLGADLIGGNKWTWMEQHWTHHAFTNHEERDPDSFSGEPIFVWNDYPLQHGSRKWYHRFQGFYYLIVLALYWVSSVFNPQILDLRQRGAQMVGVQMESDFIKKRRKVAIALRLWYIYVHVVHPLRALGWWKGLLPIALMSVAESMLLAVLFSLSHNFERVDRDPTHISKRDSNGQVCWYKSQVETSCTYGGFWAGCLTGGLNFQVEHHLFPRMSSAWYPYIAPKVRQICAKHGVRYAYYPWLPQNLWSTWTYMYRAGTGAHWKDGNPYTGQL